MHMHVLSALGGRQGAQLWGGRHAALAGTLLQCCSNQGMPAHAAGYPALAPLRPGGRLRRYGFQKVLERIKRVEYTIPKWPRITPECRDLITTILVADPTRRLTVPQIQAHPWCGPALPVCQSAGPHLCASQGSQDGSQPCTGLSGGAAYPWPPEAAHSYAVWFSNPALAGCASGSPGLHQRGA